MNKTKKVFTSKDYNQNEELKLGLDLDVSDMIDEIIKKITSMTLCNPKLNSLDSSINFE